MPSLESSSYIGAGSTQVVLLYDGGRRALGATAGGAVRASAAPRSPSQAAREREADISDAYGYGNDDGDDADDDDDSDEDPPARRPSWRPLAAADACAEGLLRVTAASAAPLPDTGGRPAGPALLVAGPAFAAPSDRASAPAAVLFEFSGRDFERRAHFWVGAAGAPAVSAAALALDGGEFAAFGDDGGGCSLRALARPDAPLWAGALGGGAGPRVADVAFFRNAATLLVAW